MFRGSSPLGQKSYAFEVLEQASAMFYLVRRWQHVTSEGKLIVSNKTRKHTDNQPWSFLTMYLIASLKIDFTCSTYSILIIHEELDFSNLASPTKCSFFPIAS
jgi:hypothetical protein